MERPKLERQSVGRADPSSAIIGKRNIFVAAREGFVESEIYDFERMFPGHVVVGPTVIHTPITTIVLQEDQVGSVDEYRNLVVDLQH